MKKLPILDQNQGPAPLKNLHFSALSTSCFLGLEWRFFTLEYHKTHFPGLNCLKKKQKFANFDQNHGPNPFGKILIFRLFKILAFKV